MKHPLDEPVKDKIEMDLQNFCEGLETNLIGQKAYFFRTVESTQIIAKEKSAEGAVEGTIVVAEEQTAGRGRMSRTWHSAKGAGLWFSIILRPGIPVNQTPQLTLLTAVAVLSAIQQLTGAEVDIKWPNDLLIGGKKVCGILTELLMEGNGNPSAVIGIGINVNQILTDFPEDLRGKATSLYIETKKKLNTVALLQEICQKFEKYYTIYLKNGFAPIKKLWESYSVSLGKPIIARTMNGDYRGFATGINDEGALILELADGSVKEIYTADIDPS